MVAIQNVEGAWGNTDSRLIGWVGHTRYICRKKIHAYLQMHVPYDRQAFKKTRSSSVLNSNIQKNRMQNDVLVCTLARSL